MDIVVPDNYYENELERIREEMLERADEEEDES